MRIATVVGTVVAMLASGASMAFATANQAPIAVPLLGTEGQASPYPSRISVVAHGGANQTSRLSVRLYGVTHPCPRDLALLLVHDNAARYLLMSSAGGCVPFQGTTLWITKDAASAIPINPLVPFGSSVVTLPANYGAAPVFPAPAPAGAYFLGLPSDNTNVNGTWDLYVIDTAGGNRGVIAAGWSFHYDTSPDFDATAENIGVPILGTAGFAEYYPITFRGGSERASPAAA